MIDDDLFTDSNKVQKITPYRKLRLLRGWTLEQAAEIFTVSRRTLIDIELGRKDAPKWLVRNMDKTYGCNGELIDYWLPRFSVAPIKGVSLCEIIKRVMVKIIKRGIVKILQILKKKLYKP